MPVSSEYSTSVFFPTDLINRLKVKSCNELTLPPKVSPTNHKATDMPQAPINKRMIFQGLNLN